MSEKVFGPWVHFPEMYSTIDGALIFVIESIPHETSSTSSHCEKFRTLISNSWPILLTSVTFPAHASIEMYGVKFIF